jgi:hypothetical protein
VVHSNRLRVRLRRSPAAAAGRVKDRTLDASLSRTELWVIVTRVRPSDAARNRFRDRRRRRVFVSRRKHHSRRATFAADGEQRIDLVSVDTERLFEAARRHVQRRRKTRSNILRADIDGDHRWKSQTVHSAVLRGRTKVSHLSTDFRGFCIAECQELSWCLKYFQKSNESI